MHTAKNTKHSLVLILCIIVGLISALYLVVERNTIEKAQNHIENIIDYDAVLRANAFEKRSQKEAFDALKEAGVTAFAIYDRTLEKANDAGEIKLLSSQDMSNVRINGSSIKPGATYVALITGKEGYYKEIREDLYHRISKEKVKELNTSIGPVLELQGATADSYAKMNLGVSRIQAMEVANRGFNVIIRPTNYRNVTPEDIKYVFNRLEGVPHVTGIIFAGKEALGAPNHIDETLEAMNTLHIPLVGIEAINQLQYMDGARIANACAALHLSLKELTVDCGIDILSFGGTKNGLMMGECVIIFNKDLQREARFVRKQSAQLASKMRYLSCQFTAYLTDDLWLKNAAHANAMASKLYQALKELPEVTFTQKPESNQLFLTMPRPTIDRMLESYFFYFWNEANHEIRLVTSFDTTEEDVNQFIRLLRR